jgi:hypothetical protein
VSAHENGAPAKQLARETGLPLATAYHLLRTTTDTCESWTTAASSWATS